MLKPSRSLACFSFSAASLLTLLLSQQAIAHGGPRPMSTSDGPKRFVLTDAKYAKELRADVLLSHEKTGTVLVHLTESQREELSHIAHEENGACGGYELLEEEEINPGSGKSQRPSYGLLLNSAKRKTLKTFATFDQQALNDQKTLMKSGSIGIGLPQDPTVSKDPAVEAAMAHVSEENLKSTVQFLSGFQSRNHKTGDGQNAVLAFKTEVEKVLTGGKNSWKLELIPHRSTPMNSLRLTIPGSLASNEVIVAGGHIDSIAQSFFGGGKKAPGADDNASGSANLLEAARILVHHQQPAKTVEIYWYAGEEGGLLGSAEIAADAKAKGKKHPRRLAARHDTFPWRRRI
jgi:bacterial leucyl aminopeptidase